MSVLSRLQSLGIKPCSDVSEISCNIFDPAPGPSPVPPALLTQPNPLVSCLMLTRGNLDLMSYSLACYRRQTYAHRELVVMTTPEAGDKVRAFVAAQKGLDARVFASPPGLTLGDHRNLAAARARGAIIVGWDDDDLYDPRRLEITVQVLRQSGAAAVFLSRWLIWWPQRKVAAISERNTWEGTMATWRNYMPIYPPLPRGEDTVAIKGLIGTHRVGMVDCPLMYLYAITGRNTWDTPHFEAMLSAVECTFEGDEFDELNKLLSDRMPLLDYAAMLSDGGAAERAG